MKSAKQLIRFLRTVLFGFMLAVCVVIGVAPIIPKRKKQFTIEIKMVEPGGIENTTAKINGVEKLL